MPNPPSQPSDLSTSTSPLPPSTSENPPAQPKFTPFFTLISTPTTHHHPKVHYLFSDDPDATQITTAAALQTLDPYPPPHPLSSSSSSSKTTKIDQNNAEPMLDELAAERFLILDLDASGTRVVAAKSMAKDWQVVSVEVGPAPTWEGGDGEEGEEGEEGKEGGKGLMLRVEGVGVWDDGEMEGEKGLDELAEIYERRIGELRRVVEGGGG